MRVLKVDQLPILFSAMCLLMSGASLAQQIDRREQSLSIPALLPDDVIPETPSSKSTIPLLSEEPEAPATGNYTLGEPKKEVAFGAREEFLNPNEDRQRKLNNKLNPKQERPMLPEFYRDQFFGDFRSGSKFVNIIYRDHQAFDGDRIQIRLNGRIVQPDVLLTNQFRGFNIDLEPGFNKIEFTALNQGASGPNTAQFGVYDDQGKLVANNEWNLATGVSAMVIIVKE
ncbi:hypothetical protein [Croceiramulus getboli]|nr:hypothetical protein P8624_12225 [Flavobacteriaceae bacterium YJPT1-3]